jgi:hypothetical protein
VGHRGGVVGRMPTCGRAFGGVTIGRGLVWLSVKQGGVSENGCGVPRCVAWQGW